ncbi:uncharacterized protein LY79DRAFT_708121 [Colletotrichum navitas]|uniref:Uncharacterized protein n=1 Tax=Colletotrichum navitas TaxID=681940 RepID=A0AAD8PKW9_9PEZI|nr:uncharacterized protein LY79DRAFT_708121 [Colletotrichum navitas]KAK1566264.1 hypothetical protein LY79DRAFT_708121 [Colletotrichum navitas]
MAPCLTLAAMPVAFEALPACPFRLDRLCVTCEHAVERFSRRLCPPRRTETRGERMRDGYQYRLPDLPATHVHSLTHSLAHSLTHPYQTSRHDGEATSSASLRPLPGKAEDMPNPPTTDHPREPAPPPSDKCQEGPRRVLLQPQDDRGRHVRWPENPPLPVHG